MNEELKGRTSKTIDNRGRIGQTIIFTCGSEVGDFPEQFIFNNATVRPISDKKSRPSIKCGDHHVELVSDGGKEYHCPIVGCELSLIVIGGKP